jgi:hypothetical protein
VIGLVTNGWAIDSQPWLQFDLAVVGPEADPAGVKAAANLVEALRRIASAKAPLLVHDNVGAHDVIRHATLANGIELPSPSTMYVLDDHQRRVLTMASERGAYTLISREPFRTGKLAHAGLEILLEGDPALDRPYLYAIANPGKISDVHRAEAQRLAAFLRSPETQAWIAEFGRGKAGDGPLFHPVVLATSPATTRSAPTSQPATIPAASSLTLQLESGPAITLSPDAFVKLPHETVEATDHDGERATFTGVALDRLLDEIDVPLGPQLHGRDMAPRRAMVTR